MNEISILCENNVLIEFRFDEIIKDLLFFSNSKKPIGGGIIPYAFDFNINAITDHGNDPSVIWLNLIIEEVKNEEFVDTEIGYYPSYYRLEPKQKYLYLSWLSDISKQTSTSFLFILLYCLERNMIMGKYREALDAIIFLRKFHIDQSFLSHSLNSILASCYYWNDLENIKQYEINLETSWYISNPGFVYLYLINIEINAELFIKILISLGNTRFSYFKDKREVYSRAFYQAINIELGINRLHIKDLINENDIEYKMERLICNHQIDQKYTLFKIPNILSNESFISSCKRIHEKCKRLLKNISI